MKTLFSALLLAIAPIVVMAQEIVGITGPAIEPVTRSEMQRAPRRAPNSESTTEVGIQVTYHQSDARAMLQLINDFRTDPTTAWYWNEDNTEKVYLSNLQPLVIDEQLEKIAMQRAAEIVINYGHTRPNGNSCFDDALWSSVSWNSVGENIAVGPQNYEQAFTTWREENNGYDGQGHRRSMLGGDFEDSNSMFNAIGIGCVEYNNHFAWTQAFAKISRDVKDASTTTPCNEVVIVTTLLSNDKVTMIPNVEYLDAFKDNSGIWSIPAEENKVINTNVCAHVKTTKQWQYATTLRLDVTPEWTASSGSEDAIEFLGDGLIRSNGKAATLKASLFGKLALTLKLTVPSVTPFTPAVPGKPDVADLVKFVNLYKDKKLPDYNGDGKSDDKDVEDLVSDLLKAIL